MLLLSQIRDAYEGQQEELRKKNLGIPRPWILSTTGKDLLLPLIRKTNFLPVTEK